MNKLKVAEITALTREINVIILPLKLTIQEKVHFMNLSDKLHNYVKAFEDSEKALIEKHKIELNEDGTLSDKNKKEDTKLFIKAYELLLQEEIEFDFNVYQNFDKSKILDAETEKVPALFIKYFLS
jgi:hypothetical protein